MSIPPELQAKFPDLQPMRQAPSLQTWNGVGAMLYGRGDFDEETQTYVATRWFTIFFLPVLPLASYRVADANPGWYFLGRVPIRGANWIMPLLWILIGGGIAGGVLIHRHLNHPDTLAANQVAAAEKQIGQGNLRSAANKLQKVAEGKTRHAEAARRRLEALVADPPAADADEVVGLFEVAVACEQGGKLADCYRPGVQHACALADSDPDLAWKVFKVVEPVAPPMAAAELLAAQRQMLVNILAKRPDNIDATAILAEVYLQQKDEKKCKELLLAHRERLGAGEGARILGQVLLREGDFDEALPFLDAYAAKRLPALSKHGQELLARLKRQEARIQSELQSGKAVDFDYATYKNASRTKQDAMVNEYFRERLAADPEIHRAQAELARKGRVVEVALDLGIARLRRGQGMADPALRRRELEQAEKMFLAVRGAGGESDELRLFMGQVYYWMGKHAKGRKHFDDFLAANGRGGKEVLIVAGLLRQVGAVSEARSLTEESYAAEKNAQMKQQLANLRAVMALDLDDSISWLNKSNLDDAGIRASLEAARGNKAQDEDRDEEAAAFFQKAIDLYKTLPPSSQNFNNHALAVYSLYGATADGKDLDEALNLLDKAHRLAPSETITLQNLADLTLTKIWHDLAVDRIDLKGLGRKVDRAALDLLHLDAAGKKGLQDRLRDHPRFESWRAHQERLFVLVPKSPGVYGSLLQIHRFLDDAQRLEELYRRVADADLDLVERNRRTLESNQGKLDEKLEKTLHAAIARAARRLDAAGKADGFQRGVLLDQLNNLRLAQTLIGEKVDAAALLKQAEEAFRLAPSAQTRIMLIGACMQALHQELKANDPSYADRAAKHYRAAGPTNLIALTLAEEGKARPLLLDHPAMKRAVQLWTEHVESFPTEGNATAWAILRHFDEEAAGRLLKATTADEALRHSRGISARLDPLDPTNAYRDYWHLRMEGKEADALARLQSVADQGVPLYVPR